MANNLVQAAAVAGRDMAAAAATTTDNLIDGLAAACAVAVGAVDIVARIMREKDSQAPVTPDEYLFAVLAIGVYGDPTAREMALEISLAKHTELFEAFERLTGRKPDGFVRSQMVEAVRDTEKSAGSNLVSFLAERAKRDLH